MRVSTEDGMTWYEHAGRKACVSRNGDGYMVHSHWSRDGQNWMGGYGEGKPITLELATELAERFVTGQPVPEDFGGYEDNKPLLCGNNEEVR
jgi:hypothetical protein